MSAPLVVYRIPVCPFSQRLETMLALKDRRDAVEFRVVDITRPRDPELLVLTRGTTALPVMRTEFGLLKESLVILRYLDERFPHIPIARRDLYARGGEYAGRDGGRFHRGRLPLRHEPGHRPARRPPHGDAGAICQAGRIPVVAKPRRRFPVRSVRLGRDGVRVDIHAILVPRILRGFRSGSRRTRAGRALA